MAEETKSDRNGAGISGTDTLAAGLETMDIADGAVTGASVGAMTRAGKAALESNEAATLGVLGKITGYAKTLARWGGRAAVAATVVFGAYETYEAYRNNDRNGMGKAIGETGGTVGLATAGALAGSAILPGPGTLIGGAVGGITGYLGGGWAGEKIAAVTAGEPAPAAPREKIPAASTAPPAPAPDAGLSPSTPQRVISENFGQKAQGHAATPPENETPDVEVKEDKPEQRVRRFPEAIIT